MSPDVTDPATVNDADRERAMSHIGAMCPGGGDHLGSDAEASDCLGCTAAELAAVREESAARTQAQCIETFERWAGQHESELSAIDLTILREGTNVKGALERYISRLSIKDIMRIKTENVTPEEASRWLDNIHKFVAGDDEQALLSPGHCGKKGHRKEDWIEWTEDMKGEPHTVYCIACKREEKMRKG